MRPTLALAAALLVLTACGGNDSTSTGTTREGPPVVLTTFYPTTYFAQRIAGEAAKVSCPVPADADPIFYRPPADVIRRYQDADLIVLNGAEFEKWPLRTSLPDSKVVDSALGFKDEWITYVHATVHSHGPGGEHAHEGLDGHTWMDPVRARQQANAIRNALRRILPDAADAIDARAKALDQDLAALDAAWKDAAKDYAGRTIYASHPAYNYLAKRYGLAFENLDLDPEEMPDDATFLAIRTKLHQKPGTHIFWEGAPKAEIAKRIRDELGLESIEISPCEMLSDEELQAGQDFLTVMRANVEKARPALAP